MAIAGGPVFAHPAALVRKAEQMIETRARVHVLVVGAALLSVVVIHLETTVSMVEMWQRSSTFAHGWVVLPVSLWLTWRLRDALAATPLEPCYLGLIAIGLSGLGWLVAELASVASIAQFAFVLMLQAAVLTLLGWRKAWTLAFPLAFLLFMVPAGEFLLPRLMDWTASSTTAALRFSGIPVYREGNHFVLPTGTWSVVEACSGLRYLVASLMTGTLYAYLMYRSAGRRLAFVAVSIAIPLVANWLRAYLIVMIGHLSDGQLAAGIDHLIYGWLFFGVVIALMFWVGSFWREDRSPALMPTARLGTLVATPRPTGNRGALVAALMAVTVVGIWPVAAATLESARYGAVRLEPIVGETGWRADDRRLTDWSPRFVGSGARLHQTFEKDGVGRVGVYLAYYVGRTQGSELVNSENALVTAADRQWREIRKAPRTVRWGNTPVDAMTSELAGQDQRLLVCWFYWIDGILTTNDYLAKAWLALAALTGASDRSAVVVFYTTSSDAPRVAEQRLDHFVAEMGAAVDRTLAASEAKRQKPGGDLDVSRISAHEYRGR